MPSSEDGANAIASGVSLAPISAGLAEPAVRHDQLDLLVLDRVPPHFAAIGVDAAVTVDPVERSGADTHHHQWFIARRFEPINVPRGNSTPSLLPIVPVSWFGP